MPDLMTVESRPLTPALAAWENEGGASNHRESEAATDCCVAREVIAEPVSQMV